MKKLLPLAFLALACHGRKKDVQFTSFRGNVFWKYNDYVGNKPDAGADVLLYDMQDSTICYSAKADVRGDFSYDSIPAGYYLLIVISNNTNSGTLESIGEMYADGPLLSRVARFALSPELKSVYERRYQLEMDELAVNGSDYRSGWRRQALRDSADLLVLEYFRSLPDTVRGRTGLRFDGAFPYKQHIDLVTLQPRRPKAMVVDFGVTYNK